MDARSGAAVQAQNLAIILQLKGKLFRANAGHRLTNTHKPLTQLHENIALHANSLSEDDLLTCLDRLTLPNELHSKKRSIAMLVAGFTTNDDSALAMRVINLLVSAILTKSSAKANEIYRMLMRRDKVGFTMAHLVAFNGKPQHAILLIDMANKLVDNALSLDSAMGYLDAFVQKGWRTGMIIARYQDASACAAYMSFLHRVFTLGGDAHALFAHLDETSDQNWTLGMIMARYQNTEQVHGYLSLLSTLIDNGVSPDSMLKHVNRINRHGTTFTETVAASNQKALPGTVDFICRLAQGRRYEDVANALSPVVRVILFNPKRNALLLVKLLRANLFPDAVLGGLKNIDKLILRGIGQIKQPAVRRAAIVETLGQSEGDSQLHSLVTTSRPAGRLFNNSHPMSKLGMMLAELDGVAVRSSRSPLAAVRGRVLTYDRV